MPMLTSFGTPAFIKDFSDGSPQQEALESLWSARLDAFTQQAIIGNPWNATHSGPTSSYYHPLETNIPQGSAIQAPVTWFAFPNRLKTYMGAGRMPANPYNETDEQLLRTADTGEGLRPIPTTHCPAPDWSGQLGPFGPYGPRGWQDEYCEWSGTRDAHENIVRIDFVCENPEYWYSLWQISPERVAELYEQTLNAGSPPSHQIRVSVEDLQLADVDGNAVIDPSTGRPAYNPLNKWNSGPLSTRTGSPTDCGGAMHLTSTPNTLQTEIGLAGGASILREIGNLDTQDLICCAQYGQSYRNSDPHIGQQVNQAVATRAIVSLADPVGLYIQPPDFGLYTAPGDLDPSECWHVVRGATVLIDPITGQPFPGAFNLHVAFQIPGSWPGALTLADIQIAGAPITRAGQVAQTFQVGLYPRLLKPPTTPSAEPCVGTPTGTVAVRPLQLLFRALWDVYSTTAVENPVDQPMSLASNTVIVPPQVQAGAGPCAMALTCTGVTDGQPPQIIFSGPEDVVVTNVSAPSQFKYAVPGNSYPSPCQVVIFELSVNRAAAPGLRSIVVINDGEPAGPPAPGFLQIIASSAS